MPLPFTLVFNRYPLTHIPWLLALTLAACAAPGRPSPTPTFAPTASMPPTKTPTPSVTPTASHTPTVTPTRRPTVTPPPSELDDHPAKPLPVALEPGGFLSWRGNVEVRERLGWAIEPERGFDGAYQIDWEPDYESDGAYLRTIDDRVVARSILGLWNVLEP